MKRNSSLINFKSLDFSFKSLISRSSSSNSSNKATSHIGGAEAKDHNSNKNDNTRAGVGSWDTPYLKIETIQDRGEDEEPQESRRSTGTIGNTSRQSLTSLLPTATQSPNKTNSSHTPSPYLSITSSPNLRRSSTSDIIKPDAGTNVPVPGSVQQQAVAENRRPSTSSLLRKARERKEVGGNQMGRSVSQLATPTAGRAGRSAALGQRRKSMAAF